MYYVFGYSHAPTIHRDFLVKYKNRIVVPIIIKGNNFDNIVNKIKQLFK